MVKVLIVDREDGALRGTRTALEQAGFEPTYVTSGRAALRLVETRLYAVVGIEHQVADMSGADFVQRAALAAPGIGLFLLASSEEVQAARSARTKPAGRKSSSGKTPGVRLLLKPYDEAQLVATITHLARMVEMRRSTHAMASAVARPEEEPVATERPRSMPPPRKD